MSNQELTKKGEFLFFQSEDGNIKAQVIAQDETIWATQKIMAELFDVEIHTINYHLKNIFETNELKRDSVIREIRVTASDGKNYNTKFYNLDMIIAVGYRVNSQRATEFRIWATKVLKEYLIKGFAMDDERLKQGSNFFGKDYFTELLERIREIRASERLFYQKITDIFAQCSIDYDKKSETAKLFYADVQNKLHWAIHQHTAAEVVVERADFNKPHMGLRSWGNQPKGGKVLKIDVTGSKKLSYRR